MEFFAVTQYIEDLEEFHREIINFKYVCKKSKFTKHQLNNIDSDIDDVLIILFSLINKYTKTKVAKILIQKCRDLQRRVRADFEEIERIHKSD